MIVCVHVCAGNVGCDIKISSLLYPLYFLRQSVFFLNLNPMFQQSWLASKLWGSACLCPYVVVWQMLMATPD